MSVITTPSRFHILSAPMEPWPPASACWPLLLPAMLTRSTTTPGTFFRTPQGSRAFGIFCSSSATIVVEVPRFFTSTSGVSPMTSTVSSIVATFRVKARLTFSAVVTLTSRVSLPKPVRATVIL